MKKVLAMIMACAMLTGCAPRVESIPAPQKEAIATENDSVNAVAGIEVAYEFSEDVQPEFDGLNDGALLQYVEDNLYAGLNASFDSEDYAVENIATVYISEEYLEELAYNSQSNVYFGYTLEELDAQFQGTRYIFTLGDGGKTTVQQFQAYDDTYDRVLENVALGTGVILICVTVSIATGGAGMPTAVNMIFTSAAKTGTIYALSSGGLSAVIAGIVKGIQTGDFDEAVKAAALIGSDSFKWGAITGVFAGGADEAIKLYQSARTVPSYRQSELTVLERTDNAVEQVAYIDGVEVSYSAAGATRPDVVVRNANGTVDAIEVKNYNLSESANRAVLLNSLEREITDRTINLPAGSTQQIVLDVRGRNFTDELIEGVKTLIWDRLENIYPNIPITVMRY